MVNAKLRCEVSERAALPILSNELVDLALGGKSWSLLNRAHDGAAIVGHGRSVGSIAMLEVAAHPTPGKGCQCRERFSNSLRRRALPWVDDGIRMVCSAPPATWQARHMSSHSVLVVDGANVVGARPDRWWKDRAGAARRLHNLLMTAGLSADEVVLVLEGQAKAGIRPGRDGHVRTVHASGSGDDAIVACARQAGQQGAHVTVATADRLLMVGVAPAAIMSPTALWAQLDSGTDALS